MAHGRCWRSPEVAAWWQRACGAAWLCARGVRVACWPVRGEARSARRMFLLFRRIHPAACNPVRSAAKHTLLHSCAHAAGGQSCSCTSSSVAACRWRHALPRLARTRGSLPAHLKLMTLFLGRTATGVATVPPAAWQLYAPADPLARFEMFQAAQLHHHMLLSPEFQVRACACCCSAWAGLLLQARRCATEASAARTLRLCTTALVHAWSPVAIARAALSC